MKRFRFSLQKAASWTPRFRLLEKVVFISADDLMAARQQIYDNHPGWAVSMFWEIFP
jgi:hypothetical protein